MNTSPSDVGGGAPVWRAPKLVALTAASSSDGGQVQSFNEGQAGTFFGVLVKGTIFAVGSG